MSAIMSFHKFGYSAAAQKAIYHVFLNAMNSTNHLLLGIPQLSILKRCPEVGKSLRFYEPPACPGDWRVSMELLQHHV